MGVSLNLNSCRVNFIYIYYVIAERTNRLAVSVLIRWLCADALAASMGIWMPSESLTVGCVDLYRECYAWANRGECTNNVNFMRWNCRYSCSLCENNRESFWQCQDGQDNDNDGNLDCSDLDCSTHPLCQVSDAQLVGIVNAVVLQTSSPKCSAFVLNFMNSCDNTVQRNGLHTVIMQACDQSGALQRPVCTNQNSWDALNAANPSNPIFDSCPYDSYSYHTHSISILTVRF
jgi:hypothetical protein